jgi:tRNA (guanine-N7-)-methyltransferase
MGIVKLKSPFVWKERYVLIQDRVWYVPDGYDALDQFKFPGWVDPQTFSEERPICLEYCSGNGDWIAAKAQQCPEFNWVGIEKKFERTRKIWGRIKRFALSNLLVICGEGYRITRHYLANESVHSVFINFPDPWPKKRHEKHRIVRVPFIQEMHRILKPEGTLTLVTDDQEYSQFMIEQMQQVAGFISHFPAPYYVHEYPGYGYSYFADLWHQQGKLIYYHVFRKG